MCLKEFLILGSKKFNAYIDFRSIPMMNKIIGFAGGITVIRA